MSKKLEKSFNSQKTILFVLIPLTIAIFLLTYFSIKESRSDSLKLLIIQGESFIESLSSAAKNAISSENVYTLLAHKRYNEITLELEQKPLQDITNDDLYNLSTLHNLYSAHIFDTDSNLVASSYVRGSQLQLPSFVIDEVEYLLSNRDENYLLLLDEENASGESRHYYLKLSNRLDRVTVLVADAGYFIDALEQTQIGYLARQMTEDNSIDYIIYQSPDGIIFSSYEVEDLLSIESDPFLSAAIESDTVMSRIYLQDDDELLEIVRPFSTADYPFGLLRIGLSLDDYKSISRRYDWQMIIFSAGLLLLLVISIIYTSSRQKRKQITAQYDQYKSISDKIFNEMKTGVAAVNKDGNITLVNKAFESILEMYNLTSENWNDTITTKMPSIPHTEDIYAGVIEQEISYSINNRMKMILIVISSLSSDISQKEGFVVVLNDITNVRELEQKTARKERLSEMGDLAAGVAHEIRNPLNTISIASQRLAGEFIPTDNKDEYLSFTKQIKDETKRLNEIITKFLALARGQKKDDVKINLSKIVQEFVAFITAEADTLHIQLQSALDDKIYIQGDTDSIKQLLANLYNNAKEAFTKSEKVIKLSVFQQDNKIVLSFEDNGPGISETIKDKIFTPYFTTKEAGTGLGLPTVHRIVQDLSGDISVEQSELGGAKFIIRFS